MFFCFSVFYTLTLVSRSAFCFCLLVAFCLYLSLLFCLSHFLLFRFSALLFRFSAFHVFCLAFYPHPCGLVLLRFSPVRPSAVPGASCCGDDLFDNGYIERIGRVC